ncbi:hypothetical protein [Desulfosporosinus metallidurans]|uniref:hypothetical protein n=1 Tax=Desulfosporosinus metallidurans TaxID=1888891 RepID=UPI00094D70E8|nr:hypothetical protein [Desulfosporosinus metallidurans]
MDEEGRPFVGGDVALCAIFRARVAPQYQWAVSSRVLGLCEGESKKTGLSMGITFPLLRGEPWGRKRCRLKKGGRKRPPLGPHQPAMRAERRSRSGSEFVHGHLTGGRKQREPA